MIFYKISAVGKNTSEQDEKDATAKRKDEKKRALKFSEQSDLFFTRHDQRYLFFPIQVDGDMDFGAILRDHADVQKLFFEYSKMLRLELESCSFREITFEHLTHYLRSSERNGFIRDEQEVLSVFDLRELGDFRGIDFAEALLTGSITEKKARKNAEDLSFGESLGEELDRIFVGGKAKTAVGHPVHYLVRTDNKDSRKQVCRTLLSALFTVGRLKNKRFCFLDFDGTEEHFDWKLSAIYKSCENGAVLIRLDTRKERNDFDIASRLSDLMKELCEIAAKYRNQVLTVFCLPKNAMEEKELLLSRWCYTPLIELSEEILCGEGAVSFLKKKAKAMGVASDRSLTGQIDDPQRGYTPSELEEIFTPWYDKKLRGSVYPQYARCESCKSTLLSKKPTGNAFDELQSLIGLSEAKEVMNKALSYFKMQKVFADRLGQTKAPSMHMVFTGNPGTAKTTVARLFARILKENGILSSGKLLEVGRGDLVGKYVGSTAPLVQEAFRQAKGGVLFIDEAYSLIDDRDGLYGDEAINTIVQEMENHRKDTVVIFAGYPDKMEGFLRKNPGLRSRIAFHVPFPDYTVDELCAIVRMQAKENHLTLSPKAEEFLQRIAASAMKNHDFGNGRYARNLIEHAKMSLAARLMEKPYEEITDEDLTTLTEEDFTLPAQTKKERALVGF